jgi:hypothetical protein
LSRGEEVGRSAIKQRLGPNRDARDTIKARRRATSVDNYVYGNDHDHHDERCSCLQDDRRRGDATTATMTVTAAGRQTRGAHETSGRRCEIQSSPPASELRQTSPGTTGRPTRACGWRTTDSRVTWVERRTTSSSSRSCRSTSATPRQHGSSTCLVAEITTGRTCVERSSATSRAHTPAPASSGSYTTAGSSQGKVCVTTSGASPGVAPSSPV